MPKLKHGMSGSSEYDSYHAAKNRCNNPNDARFTDYGGRGVQFKFISFEEFMNDIGPRPKGMTLDRKNNDGHYEVGNVRWASPKEQMKNQRLRSDNTSGKRGVSFCKREGKWRAYRTEEGKFRSLGYFETKDAAFTAVGK